MPQLQCMPGRLPQLKVTLWVSWLPFRALELQVMPLWHLHNLRDLRPRIFRSFSGLTTSNLRIRLSTYDWFGIGFDRVKGSERVKQFRIFRTYFILHNKVNWTCLRPDINLIIYLEYTNLSFRKSTLITLQTYVDVPVGTTCWSFSSYWSSSILSNKGYLRQ